MAYGVIGVKAHGSVFSRKLDPLVAGQLHSGNPKAPRVFICYDLQHPADKITLKKLSEVSGLHQRSLLVAFNRITGTSPVAYVRRLRLQRVHDALQKSRYRRGSITDIAHECGFLHLGHFGEA